MEYSLTSTAPTPSAWIKTVCLVLIACVDLAAYAQGYGRYQAADLIKPVAQAGQCGSLDIATPDRQLADLARYAGNYPPKFESAGDAARAKQDAVQLIGMLGAAFSSSSAPPELLLRTGKLGAIGHNLSVPGATEFAQSSFQRLLKAESDHAQGNFNYGVFLASTNRAREALPWRQKAKDKGVVQAHYALGMSHLALGNKELVEASLKAYQFAVPGDHNTARLLEANQTMKGWGRGGDWDGYRFNPKAPPGSQSRLVFKC